MGRVLAMQPEYLALLGHYSMVVHHDERSSDGQNCGLGSYFLSAAGMLLYPSYIRRFSTLAIKRWRLWCPKMWGVGSLCPPNIIVGTNEATWRDLPTYLELGTLIYLLKISQKSLSRRHRYL